MVDRIFWGVDKLPHEIPLCSVADLPHLQRLYALINEELTDLDGIAYPSHKSLYLYNQRFRTLCNEILKVNGINPGHCNIEQVIQFVIENGDEPPILAKLNGLTDEDVPTQTESQLTPDQQAALMLGILMRAGVSHEGAVSLLQHHTYEELEKILDGLSGRDPTKPKKLSEMTESEREKHRKEVLDSFLHKKPVSPNPFTGQTENTAIKKDFKLSRSNTPPPFLRRK